MGAATYAAVTEHTIMVTCGGNLMFITLYIIQVKIQVMSNKLVMDLDNTITIDESASVYESKKPNLEVVKARKNAEKLGMSSTIFSLS